MPVTNEKIESYIIEMMNAISNIQKDMEYIKGDRLILTDLSQRVLMLERAREQKITSRVDKIIDYVLKGLAVIALGAIIAYFGIKLPPKPF